TTALAPRTKACAAVATPGLLHSTARLTPPTPARLATQRPLTRRRPTLLPPTLLPPTRVRTRLIDAMIYALAALVAIVAFLWLSRHEELFCVSVRDGRVLVL